MRNGTVIIICNARMLDEVSSWHLLEQILALGQEHIVSVLQ